MPSLRVLQGDVSDRCYPLGRDVTVLGRDAACDIVLPDQEVSKRHARITRQGDGYLIEDLQSTNGTKVGDRDLTGARLLEDGDRIEIGGFRLVFSGGGPAVLSALDASSTEERQTARVRPGEKLCAVLEIARELVGTVSLDGVLGKILDALFRVFPLAERGFILLRGEATDELVLRASKVRQPEAGSPLFSRTIFNHVVGVGQAVVCEDVGADERFGQSESVRESQIRTVLCVPVWDRERCPIGVLQIDTRDEKGRFGPDDLDLLAAVAGPVSVAVENARLHEVALKQAEWEREARDARAVQQALIPGRKPDLPGYAFWDSYEPARFVGGDYFDYRPVPTPGSPSGQPPARWAVAIGDVSGKGMPAALLMARLSSQVGLLLQADPDPARMVERLNDDLCATRAEGRFVTFLAVLVDGERHELTLVNAGHMPPLIRRSGGRVEGIGEVQAGLPLGIDGGQPYEAVRTSLCPGDVVVLHTDGINEAMDREGRQFGFERLREALVSAPGGAPAVGEAILAAVRSHVAGHPHSDDMTLVCCGRA
jgi:serine phosphatase RsbU (regulator of sigma subunit)